MARRRRDDEEECHDKSGDGEEFTDNGDAAIILGIVEVVWQHDHDAPGGDPDKEGEVADVETPGDVTAHTGDLETDGHLIDVCSKTDDDEGEEEYDPRPIFRAAAFDKCFSIIVYASPSAKLTL